MTARHRRAVRASPLSICRRPRHALLKAILRSLDLPDRRADLLCPVSAETAHSSAAPGASVHQAADNKIAARSWMLPFGIIHGKQRTPSPGDLLVSCDMNKRWQKAPQLSLVRCIEIKATTSEQGIAPRRLTEHKLGTPCRSYNCLAVFRLKRTASASPVEGLFLSRYPRAPLSRQAEGSPDGQCRENKNSGVRCIPSHEGCQFQPSILSISMSVISTSDRCDRKHSLCVDLRMARHHARVCPAWRPHALLHNA